MVLLESLNIIAGLVLAAGVIEALPAMGKHLKKISKFLGSFQTIIGIVALILGLMNFAGIQGIVAIVAGLVLLTGALPMIPAVGKSLEKVAKRLGAFQAFIGIIALIAGIWGLLF